MNVVPDWPPDFPLRFFEDEAKRSWALFSPCARYRYRLRREWGEGKVICYVMLNPSTADEVKNDPTVERCERRARALGFGAMEVVNIFALRSTDPAGLYADKDPVGEQNDRAILETVKASDEILIAWGAHGALHARADAVRRLLNGFSPMHLGFTKAGEPRHPLYVAYAQRPERLVL